ncbi:hypothetical protein, partial [Mycobacterium sp.]|uniref:hypothetical protein n=1 Tax=Mycobacterium sp. TaxID=1785 RepID=UPI0031DEAC3F
MVVQHVLRPYATAGVALVGASMIAVTPLATPLPAIQMRPVKLVDAWSELIANTTTNLDSIISHASSPDITQLFSELFTNPYGVIEALANFDPTVTTDLTSLPATISVELPPGLELAIAGLGAEGATFSALESVLKQLQADPSATNLYEGVATVLNAYLNGADNVSLLDGAITIPLYNGVLAPATSANIDINLPDLLNALGLGNTPLTNLDLSNLLSQLGLGDLTLGSLFSDLGLSDKGLGTLLADATSPVTTLSGLLNLLGLNALGSGDGITLGLTNILQGLGLDTNVDLNNLSLSSVLSAFGIDPTQLLSPDSLLGALGLNTGDSVNVDSLLGALGLDPTSTISTSALDSLLGTLGLDPASTISSTTLTNLLTSLNLDPSAPLTGSTLDTVLTALGADLTAPLTGSTLDTVLTALGADPSGSLTTTVLDSLLSSLGLNTSSTIGSTVLTSLLDDLGLGSTTTVNTTVGDLLTGVLTAFGIPESTPIQTALDALISILPSGTAPTVGTLLDDLGITAATPTVGTLLHDLGLSSTASVGTLLADLGLSGNGVDVG